MKISYIVPGSGGTFYCQNCLRDTALITELRTQNYDIFTAPMYLPLFNGEKIKADNTPVFFGAVNLYLKYKYSFLKNMPDWLSRLLDSTPVLRFAAKKSESTSAEGLEDMTIAMLKGKEGALADDISTLINWLQEYEQPDIIHISNALLLGLAKPLKELPGIKIICSLQDENLWIDKMKNPQRTQVWRLMAQKAQFVDKFIAVSKYYANLMQDKMHIPEDKIDIIPIGINPDDYRDITSAPAAPAIGYLSKITESLGFSILLNAFVILKQSPELRNLQLHATGGLVGNDIKYVRKIRSRLKSLGFDKDFIIHKNFSLEKRRKFMQKISVLSVPVPGGEAFGTYLLEAMAAGIPVVQPDEGSFPELIEATYGGITYSPNRPSHLAAALKSLLLDHERAGNIGERGRKAVQENFSINKMAEKTAAVYKTVLPSDNISV